MPRNPGFLIYYQAIKFYELAMLGYEKDELVFPVITNLAFAIELLLKSHDSTLEAPGPIGGLMQNTTVNSKLRGHNLLNLLKGMESDKRNELIFLYKESSSGSLEKDLEVIQQYFVNARYSYEKQNFGIYHITLTKNIFFHLRLIVEKFLD